MSEDRSNPSGAHCVLLTDEQKRVLLEKGTERPHTSPLNKEYRDGTYRCAGCGEALFTSSAKFNSGTGWPSFFEPIVGSVKTEEDLSYGMRRTEVVCARCHGHLGHVFEDGPKPTGLRFCINGVSLNFVPENNQSTAT